MNIAILIGRLTRDPELRYLANTGTPVATFTLAVDRELSKEKRQEMELKGQSTADFINIVVWGKQAENCANYLKKGRLAAVKGRLQSRSYEAKDGTRRYVTEVIASQVEFLERKERHNDFDIDGFESADDELLPF
mgnify:CR=1 FL=1